MNHEQGHFDICELYARVLRRDIRKAKSLAEAKDIYEKTIASEESEQDNYDEENTYGSGGITLEWKNKIAGNLKQLDLYKQIVVTLPIDR